MVMTGRFSTHRVAAPAIVAPPMLGPEVVGPLAADLPLIGMAATGGFGDAGASVDRRASSKVPHIPQKRKLSELFSPHFGQIKLILRLPFFLIV